ncbi:MAG: 2,5-diamino-6-(ribosylamino)-4(3H)-pyrimidinone 5'-phosphate reductase [Candidatus Helarchaeota archaeon]
MKSKSQNRPYCILNAAMSIDGKISTITGDVELSSKEDWIRVHKLRSEMDGIMVGINTIIKDNPKLRIKFFKRKTGKLHRIIVDSQLRIPLNSKVLNFELDNYPTIIITTTNAPENKVNQIKRMNSEINIIKCGSNNKVDLKIMVEKLKSLGINKILLEGGGTLNFSMLKNRLVDELRIAIAPVIIGGKNAITLVEGYGFEKISNAIKLKLIKKQMFGHNLVLYYHIQN